METQGLPSEEPDIAALRDHRWGREHPEEPLLPSIWPRLLVSWEDQDPGEAAAVELDE